MIVAIIDKVAGDIVGPLMMEKHPATALRLFDDLARDTRSTINMHLKDHEMWVIGTIDDGTLEITPRKDILMTGELWLAAQPAKGEENK